MHIDWREYNGQTGEGIPSSAAVRFEFEPDNFVIVHFSKDNKDKEVLMIKRYYKEEEIYNDILRKDDGNE